MARRTGSRGHGHEVPPNHAEERERRRLEILTVVDRVEASLARGEGWAITQESMRELAQEVKARGRARLAADQSSGRS